MNKRSRGSLQAMFVSPSSILYLPQSPKSPLICLVPQAASKWRAGHRKHFWALMFTTPHCSWLKLQLCVLDPSRCSELPVVGIDELVVCNAA